MNKSIDPPFKPYVSGPDDTRNIDKMFLNEPAKETPAVSILSPNTKQRNHFENFTYMSQEKANKLKA
jgi:hypothetical protein